MGWGTEGIVRTLYEMIIRALKASSIETEPEDYFALHIGCDDEHADSLRQICEELRERPDAEYKRELHKGTLEALDLRNAYYLELNEELQSSICESLFLSIENKYPEPIGQMLSSLMDSEVLYRNEDKSKGIDFSVQRVDVGSSVIDPRVLTIPPNKTNEDHRHAHETIMLVLDGKGEITIEDESFEICSGDVAYVPRWLRHCTKNTGDKPLRIFAVTDFKLTRRWPSNTEESYRSANN